MPVDKEMLLGVTAIHTQHIAGYMDATHKRQAHGNYQAGTFVLILAPVIWICRHHTMVCPLLACHYAVSSQTTLHGLWTKGMACL